MAVDGRKKDLEQPRGFNALIPGVVSRLVSGSWSSFTSLSGMYSHQSEERFI